MWLWICWLDWLDVVGLIIIVLEEGEGIWKYCDGGDLLDCGEGIEEVGDLLDFCEVIEEVGDLLDCGEVIEEVDWLDWGESVEEDCIFF